MNTHTPQFTPAAAPSRNVRVEFIGAVSTFLTLSYVFLLNPVLLQKAGIDISAAFFATVVSAALSTLLMGLWAKLPFAVAPAPSITTFFVSFVCLKWGVPWQGALTAVVISGALSILMAYWSVRRQLVESVSGGLQMAVLCAVCGFLVSNGLVQAKLVSYPDGLPQFAAFSGEQSKLPNLTIFAIGLAVTILFSRKRLKFAGAPILGILAATIAAAYFGIKSQSRATFSMDMFSAVWKFDLSMLLNMKFVYATLVFVIIDFYGGVGKYIALFTAMRDKYPTVPPKPMARALYVDGIGNVLGGILGASSLAIFVSSAAGIAAGARTGLTAVFVAGLMVASLAIIPLVGAIPVEATSGILVYIGLLLMPWKDLLGPQRTLDWKEASLAGTAGLISFATYAIDKAILLVFLAYSIGALRSGFKERDLILHVTTVLLLASVVSQMFLK